MHNISGLPISASSLARDTLTVLSPIWILGRTYIVVMIALYPSDQAENGENLRLDLQCNVEIRGDVVCTKGDTGTGPEEHH